MKKEILFRIVILTVVSSMILGFCIITNTSGVYRKYFPSDLPFIYRLNVNTPDTYIDPIWRGAKVWNDVPSSYFEFKQGETTTAQSVGRDGINLVFFDLQGVNFSNPNVIAFSSTFTTGAQGYKAYESDLVWNSKDHPPSPTGASNAMDLQSTIAHEFGHHLGLDHTGLPAGANSGCGPLVPAATMWWATSNGDTSGRILHIEDIVGLAALYPNWVLEGFVIDASTASPLSNAKVKITPGTGAVIGPPHNPITSRWNRAGYVMADIPVQTNGSYSTISIEQNITASVSWFGFFEQTQNINFNEPSGFGNTHTVTFNASLLPTPRVDFSGTIFDTLNNQPVSAEIEFYWMENKDSVLTSISTDANGQFTKEMPSYEYYKVVVNMDLPYVAKIQYDSVYLGPEGLALNINVKPVSNLLVIDETASAMYDKYFTILELAGLEYAIWNNENELSYDTLAIFDTPLTLIWATGGSSDSGISEEENELMKQHLRNGGGLLLAGRNIVEYSVGDSLFESYMGITFNGNHTAPFTVRGFPGHPIGGGMQFSSTLPSKDIMKESDNSQSVIAKAFYYGGEADTTKIGAVTFENNDLKYKGFVIGLGFESFGNDNIAAEIMRKTLNWIADRTLTSVDDKGVVAPLQFTLHQNYPNPFNPVTTINYTIAEANKVELTVYDALGRKVTSLVNEFKQAGSYSLVFDASRLASGVYYYRITSGSFVDTKKLVLLK